MKKPRYARRARMVGAEQIRRFMFWDGISYPWRDVARQVWTLQRRYPSKLGVD